MPFLTQGKTNWKYIAIVVILAAITGTEILWFEKKYEVSFTQLPEIKKPEKIQDETANWKTYRNEELGFEFKYPQNVCFKEEKDSIEFSNCESPTNVQIAINITTEELSIHDYLKQYGTEEKAERLYSKEM